MGFADNVTMEEKKGFLWITAPATITVDNYRLIEDKIESQLSSGPNRLVIDLGKTENIYSSGIGLLVRLQKQLKDMDGSLSLVNVSKKLRDLFESMRLEKVLPIYATDVEFEISHDEVWSSTVSKDDIAFVFTSQVEDGVYRLAFSGSMDALHDLSPVSEFKPTEAVAHYILNLENLDTMDTYGSQLLLEVVQRINKHGGKTITYGANDMIRELLKLLSIDRFVVHCDSEKEALESAQK